LNLFYAVLLGLIQGLTEFLPISSTAHLTLTGKLLGLVDATNPQAWTSFIAVIQLGTLGALLIYFFRDIVGMTSALIQDIGTNGRGNGLRGYSHESRLALAVSVGTIPMIIAGLLLKDIIEGMFTKSTPVIIASLITLAAFLWLAEKVARHVRQIESVTVKDALVIGIAQALALIPGSSRSGTTIAAGLFLNFTRHSAARFSFLLSIPAILGSGLYQVTKIEADMSGLGIHSLILATVVAGISGYAAIFWLIRYLMKHSTMLFVWYRFGLGLVLTAMLLTNMIQP